MNFQFYNFSIFKRIIFSLIFLSGFLLWGNAQAASVTVCDSGNGCDYTTIAAAINAVTTGTANTITVNSPYSGNERVTVDKAGASDANRLVIQAGTGYVQGSTYPKTKGFIVTSAYVTVQGFEMTACGDTTCGIAGADYVNFFYNYVHGSDGNEGNDAWEIGTDETFRSYVKINNNKITSDVGGVALIKLVANYSIADSNEMYDCEDCDAFNFWGHDSTISNNYIHGFTIVDQPRRHSDCFQTFGDGGIVVANNWIIEKNVAVSPGTTGVDSEGVCLVSDGTCGDMQPFNLSYDGEVGLHDITFRNNIWVNYGTQGNVGVPNTKFYNNTFINVAWINVNAGISFAYNPPAWDDTGCVVKNNLFVQNFNQDPFVVDARITHNNNYVTRYNGASPGDPVTFYAVTGWSETGGVNGGDPKLTSLTLGTCPGDWSESSDCTQINCGTYDFDNHTCSNFDLSLLTDSPAKDVGANLTSVWADATDIIDTARPQGNAWDIGAYEYVSESADTTAPAAPTSLSVS